MKLGSWTLDRVHHADCVAALKDLPDDCVDVAVTSPPYWGQRESSGLGCEEDPREYVKNLVDVFAEVMRVLKPEGTFWLNVGDAYNTPVNWRLDDRKYSSLGPDQNGLADHNSAYTKKRAKRRAFIDKTDQSLQYGNLLGLPYRIVLGLTERGFLFRGEVIWQKTRPLPEGICRRPHRKHEGIYIIAKSERHRFRVKPPVPSVWTLVQTPNKTPHCSTFPLDLPLQAIKAADVLENAVVLDPFMGSGTTAKAAKILGHHYLGFEVDEKICRIADDYIASDVQESLPLGAV